MKAIILAAGKGSRLGDPNIPKPLTQLNNGKSILGLQLEHLSGVMSLDDVIVVVGFHKEMIMEAFPDLSYVYNPSFAAENTSKSLLRAIKKVHEDLLWLNGDVVFNPSVLRKVLQEPKTSMLVNQAPVAEEEVKYALDFDGKIIEISKAVKNPVGEALGINFMRMQDLEALRSGLEECQDQDYFEKGIQIAINKGLSVWPVVVDADSCTEVDFPEDLIRANRLVSLSPS